MAGQVQVNFRVSRQELAVLERARGSLARNAWLLAAMREKFARDGAVPCGVAAPPGLVVVSAPSRPVSVRAPRGCRVVGVSAAVRALSEVPVPIPGQITVDEALAS